MSIIFSWLKDLFEKKDETPISSSSNESSASPNISSTESSADGLQGVLAWERASNDGQVNQGPHPERRPWSEALYKEIEAKYDILIQAKDLATIFPRFFVLNKPQRITVLAELMCRVAEYESSWNPKSTSKDVNGRSDSDSLATGFFQLNVADQKTYETGTSFTHDELLDPFNNIKAGVGILATMVKVRGKITRSPGDPGFRISEFFETLIFGAKYESITKILAAVKVFGDALLDKKPEKSRHDQLMDLAKSVGCPTDAIAKMLAIQEIKYPSSNANYWAIADMSQHSSRKRLYVFSLKDDSISQYLVSHGKGSDDGIDDGFAKKFSNVPGSNCTSLGVYRCAETYIGNHGTSCRLDGLESTNSNARGRDIVIHSANYVSDDVVKESGRCGRSEGCFALDPLIAQSIISQLKNGSFLICWH